MNEVVNLEPFADLAVIIPFHENDLLWKDLLRDLKYLPASSEIILVGPLEPNPEVLTKSSEGLLASVKYIFSEKGRGRQLNAGAKNTDKNYLWFLHADSKVPRPALTALQKALQFRPDALHFFNLQFLNDGPKLTQLNSLLANWRSRYLLMPFGDQGFVIRRSEFYRVGGFPEHEPYGEDHVFVWEARRKRVPVLAVPASIFTSARRYDIEGWSQLTSKRVCLTAKQASKEAFKLFKTRVIEVFR
jgi:hypothetical protein